MCDVIIGNVSFNSYMRTVSNFANFDLYLDSPCNTLLKTKIVTHGQDFWSISQEGLYIKQEVYITCVPPIDPSSKSFAVHVILHALKTCIAARTLTTSPPPQCARHVLKVMPFFFLSAWLFTSIAP